MELFDKVMEARDFIQSKISDQPKIGIVLGTGLGALAEEVIPSGEISFSDIPHFPTPTVVGHQGKMIFGTISEKPVLLLAGRFHYYEGFSMKEVTFPIRVLAALGIDQVVLSNVSGGLQADLNPGNLVFIKDHINLQPENPLRGKNDERLGPRFPDMLFTYNRTLNKKALEICKRNNIPAREGVYVALQGPNLETPAEYNYLHTIGGDVVGMSTVPEVIVARHMDMKVFVVSIVSNKCFPIEEITPTSVEEVVAVANKASDQLRKVMKELLLEI